jgi:hypothetical protein
MPTPSAVPGRPAVPALAPTFAAWRDPLGQLLARERRLTLYAVALFALLLPLALASGLDERTLRGVNVWIKPMKFAVSIGVLAITTAWFIGHLSAERRTGRAIDWIVGLLIASGSFELVYIVVQAALGQGSHYNIGDPLHATLYTAMGIGAVVLTATQPLLAWQLFRHPDTNRPAAHRLAVLLGLVLSFVFGAGAGGLLSGLQPPDGGAGTLFGWVLRGGDLRPAHFVGLHVEQALPALAWAATALGIRRASAAVWASTLAYALLFAALVAWGLAGRL